MREERAQVPMSQDIPETNQALPPASFAQPQVHAGITQLERALGKGERRREAIHTGQAAKPGSQGHPLAEHSPWGEGPWS